MSIGEEEGKGNELTKEAYELLKESSLNFVGNVEGRDIYNGSTDVVVTDGFTGNVLLGASEAAAAALMRLMRDELRDRSGDAQGLVAGTPSAPHWRIDPAGTGGPGARAAASSGMGARQRQPFARIKAAAESFARA
jgi:glycerol-3-phosphate acyltransferase PlsX